MPANLRELDAEIARLAAEISTRMARWLDLIGQFDAAGLAVKEGFRSTSDWLAWRCGIDPRTARQHVHAARRLQQMPTVQEAFAGGELSYSKVRALARAPEDADERELLHVATRSSAARLEQHVRALRSAPSADPEAARRAHDRRYADWRWNRDGALDFRARLAADDGVALIEVIETAAAALHLASSDAPAPGPGARRADARRDRAQRHTASPGPPSRRPAGTGMLRRAPGRPRRRDLPPGQRPRHPVRDRPPPRRRRRTLAHRPRHPPRSRPHLARSLTSAARLPRPTRRRVPVPGCHRRHGLYAHHLIHWALGGNTDRDNLVLLCHFHHRLLHDDGFTARREHGTVVFRRPDGCVIREIGEQAFALAAA